MAIKTIYHFTALTGGAATALDSVDGNSLLDLDRAFTLVSGTAYIHQLDAASGAAESSPDVIAPDTNPGTKRWILQSVSATVNLTGPITSVGNATSVASQTGTGSTFVMNSSPTLITPTLGVATATSINKLAITAPATAATLTIAEGKTLTASNTITFTATDGSTLAIGTGGTLGTAAYTASTAYEAAGGISTHAALTATHGATGAVAGTTNTQTLTNKRITKRTGTTTSSATPTINTDNVDFYSLTAQAEDITSFTTNLSGTPTEAQTLWIAVTGTAARALSFGASFEASTVALPTTTVTTARLDMGFVWNSISGKWRVVAVC